MKRWILIVSASFALSAPALAAATAQLGPPVVLEELAPPTLYDVVTLSAAVSPEIPPAALPVIDEAANVEVLAQLILHAISTSNWRALAALAVVVLVWLVRRFGGKYVPWVLTPRGGATLVVLLSVAGAVANALLAGAPLSLALLLDSAITGALATGFRKLALAFSTPAVSPIPTAEAAGTKAAAAVPLPDLEGIANGTKR